jgi:flagellar hook-associated protein 3 FlgL
MRVTANAYSSALIEQLNTLALRQTKLQAEAATGQRLRLPEDDPAAMRRVLDLQSESSAVAQYQKNIDRQKDLATAVYGGVKSLKTISDRAGEIATLADSLKSPGELAAYASEVTQLIKQAVEIGNSQHNGSYLFAGTRSDQPAFAMTTNPAGDVTNVAYQGNSNLAACEISEGLTVTAQVPGANNTGSGSRGLFVDASAGADFFSHLISLQQNLASGNVTAIAANDRPQLQHDEDNLLFHVSQNGAIQARLDASKALLADHGSAVNTQISNEADADLAQTLVQFNATQNAYQAALQSGAKLFNMSLMNYLQ